MSKYAAVTGTVAIADPDDPTNVLEPTLPHIDAVTPNDAADLANSGILLIAVGGAIKITTRLGDTGTVTVPAGYLYVKVARVWATGTTASGISVLY